MIRWPTGSRAPSARSTATSSWSRCRAWRPSARPCAPGSRVAREVYADRAYGEDGNLAPRKEPGAVIHDADEAVKGVLRMLDEQAIRTQGGTKRPVRIDSVSVHSDTQDAVSMARALRTALERHGAAILPFGSFVD